jgi:bisphosphoglycerate-dependent phosphoglycerate mutase
LGTVSSVRMVFLLRHGKSSWSDPSLADLDRPLAPRGERVAEDRQVHMRRKKIRPSLVLCSPSLRTGQTLEAIEPSLGKGSSVQLEPELYAASETRGNAKRGSRGWASNLPERLLGVHRVDCGRRHQDSALRIGYGWSGARAA